MDKCTSCYGELGFYGTDPSRPWIGYTWCEKCQPFPTVWTNTNPAIIGMLNAIMVKLLELEEQVKALRPDPED